MSKSNNRQFVSRQEANLPLFKWRDDFFVNKKAVWAEDTFRTYRSILNQYIDYVGADHWPPSRLSIMQWLDEVRTRASATTAATYWRHIKAWLNYLEVIDALSPQENAVHIIKRLRLQPRAPEQDYQAFSPDELDKLFNHLRSLKSDPLAKRDLALLHFQYVTGCRSGEVVTLKFPDIHVDDEIPWARIKGTISKSRKYRIVYFNDAVKRDVKTWFTEIRKQGYTGDFVFPSMKHSTFEKRLTRDGLHQMLQRRLDEVGLPHRKVHALRHASARHALASGIDLRKVRDQLGHSNISVTAKYLRGLDPDRANAYYRWREEGQSQ